MKTDDEMTEVEYIGKISDVVKQYANWKYRLDFTRGAIPDDFRVAAAGGYVYLHFVKGAADAPPANRPPPPSSYATLEDAQKAMAGCDHDGDWKLIDSQFSTELMRTVWVGSCLKCGFTGRVPARCCPP